MSQENLEIARQAVACVNRGDDEGFAALMAEDVMYFPIDDSPAPGPRAGLGVCAQLERGFRTLRIRVE